MGRSLRGWWQYAAAVAALVVSGCFVDEKLLTGGQRDAAMTPADLAGSVSMDLGGAAADLATSPQMCDEFAGTAVGALPATWTGDTGVWRVVADGAGHALQQMMAAGGAGNLYLAWTGALTTTNATVSATVRAVGSAGSADCVVARRRNVDDFYALCLVDGAAWHLERASGGQLATLTMGSFAYAAGSSHTLVLGAHGTTLTAWVDGTKQAEVTDANFADGAVGLATSGTSTFSHVCIAP